MVSGFIGTETVTASSVTSAFSDKNVGNGKTVTISAITLADGTNGGLAANYGWCGTNNDSKCYKKTTYSYRISQ